MEFTNDQLKAAMEKISKGDVPDWMNSYEKQAFALGVINEEHIIEHEACKGRGEHNSFDGPDCMAMCMGCRGRGVVISDQGKALIKSVFPDYKMRNLQDS